ncbi:amino acid ABC transporter substrate-binding protein [Sinosporangium siamense]|uniref:amino acid ABC transporter substrate-binding protein n=1 Tax=Sinosporangium siamense TaxID=1367973 RepID=UPI0019516AB0|nr:amino acid ABC transporter substrate-binding protein [Sinosporangium siamense]
MTQLRKYRHSRLRLCSAAAAALLLTAACGQGASSGGGDGPIKIGSSLPLTGEFSEAGQATQKGYQTWVALTNQNGGLLGRQVEIIVKDDATNQNTVVTDYNALIAQDKVDLLLGTQSSLLNLPASAIAERNRMLYVEPAGGAPELFERGFTYLFFSQQATTDYQGAVWAKWVASLPADKRPRKVAYPSVDDPFSKSVADGVEKILTAAGIQTAYKEVYPLGTKNLDSIVNAVAASGADAVVHGSVFEDGVTFVRAMERANFKPKLIYQSQAPAFGKQYLDGVGQKATEGMFYSTSWNEVAETPGNAAFVAKYRELFKEEPTEDAADGFAAAEVVAAAVKGVGGIEDQKALADWLHANKVDTILGTLSWDKAGRPTGEYLVGQWQNGKAEIVLPPEVATSKRLVRYGGGDL